MKKIFSMFLIFIMVLPSLLVNAEDTECLIEFDRSTPTYSISGTHAFISGHHEDSIPVAEYNNQSGWLLSPTESYNTICINLADNFMNKLPGTQDVLMDVCYYDGSSSDKGSKFCVYYDSQNHYNENAGIVELGGTGVWKTHTFVLEKPRLNDIGNAPLRNIAISVTSSYMGASSGNVAIGSAKIYYGEKRELFFSVDSENIGNIFFNDESVELDVILENPYSVSHGDLTAKLTLTSKTDGSIYETEKTVAMGSSKTVSDKISLDDLSLPFGIYDISADIYRGNTLVASDRTEFSRISAKKSNEPSPDGINNSFLGINTHAARYSADSVRNLVYLAERSGAGFIRTTIGWESVEKAQGIYEISEMQRTLIQEAKNKNLKITAVLGNSNTTVYPDYMPWRTGYAEEDFQKYLENYSAYVEYVVSELKDDVECWEIYNEYTMDYPDFDSTDTDIAVAAARDYADILRTGYEAVKREDPAALVVGGAFAGVTDSFAGTLYDTFGVSDYMDAVSFHSYCGGSDTSGEIDTLNNYKNRLSGYIDDSGAEHKIYLDEFNFHTGGTLNEEEQAIYNVRLLTKEKYLGDIDRIYSYNLESSSYDNPNGYGFVKRPEDDYDYLKKTMAARPNFAALAFMNKLLRLSDAVEFTEDANGNYIYEFYDNINERPVYVIWNKTRDDSVTSDVTIDNPGIELTAYDMYGNEISTSMGTLTVTAGKKPVYVTSPEKDFLVGQDDETYKVSIQGVGTIGDNISIVVLNKGTRESDFSMAEQILYTNQKQIDSEGNWSFTFKVTQGNGEYTILLTEEDGGRFVYNLSYNAGNMQVNYELYQEDGGVYDFDSVTDGNLDINYRIENPENKESTFNIFGCLYMGDKLVKVVKSPDSKLLKTDLIKTGSITIPNIKKSEIDKVQIMIFDGTDNIKPLYPKFVLE